MPSELDNALNQIGDESVAEIKKEWQDLLAAAKADSTGFMKENAEKLENRLVLLNKGEIDQDDFDFFIKNQTRAAEIFVASQPALAQERAEKLTIRLLGTAAAKIAPVLIGRS